MSGTNWTQIYGPGSPAYDEQAAAYQRLVEQSRQSTLAALRPLMVQEQQQAAIDRSPAGTAPATPAWHDEDLVGAAMYWGIPEAQARAMPRDQLIGIVNQFRGYARPHGEAAIAPNIASTVAQFGVGAGEAITGGLEHLPLIGKYARDSFIHGADMWFRQLEEGVRSSTSAGAMQTVESGANLAGNFAAMAYPATAAWKVAGAAGAFAPVAWAGRLVTNPILRAAAQGGASAWLLEGGSQHPLEATLGGAAFGGAFEAARPIAERVAPLVMQAAKRVQAAFGIAEPIPPEVRLGTAVNPLTQPPEPGPIVEPPPPPAGPAFGFRQETPPLMPEFGFRREVPSPGPTQGLAPEYNPLDPVADAHYAAWQAAQANKAQTIIESPSLPKIVQQTALDEGSVVEAAATNNPGGTNIVQGVADPASILGANAAAASSFNRVRFAQRAGRLDALVSDQPITDKMVADYERTGFHEGMTIRTSKGVEGTVGQVGSDYVRVERPGKPPFKLRMVHASPGTASPGEHIVPQMWEQLRAQVGDMTDPAVRQHLPELIDAFLDGQGIQDVADRSRIKTYFGNKYVEEFQKLAPEESAKAAEIGDAVAAVNMAAPSTPTDIYDLAASKGFKLINTGQDGRWNVADGNNGNLLMTFGTRDAAETWLRNVNRDLPDITPASDVPLEVAGALPTASHAEPSLDPAMEEKVVAESAVDLAKTAEAQGEEPLGHADAVQALVTHPENRDNLARLLAIREQGLARWRPTRARMLGLQQIIDQSGIGDVNLWKWWDTLNVARDRAHNWSYPLQDEIGTILNAFKRSDLRDGTVSRVFMGLDPMERLAAGNAAGFTEKQHAAMEAMHEFAAKILPESANPAEDIATAITRVQVAQSTGVKVADLPAMDVADPVAKDILEAFQDHLGGRDIRNLDARTMWGSFIGASRFQRYMAADWAPIAEQVGALRRDLPEMAPALDVMHNWMQMAKYGYKPGADAVMGFFHGALNFLIPGITKQDARIIFNDGLGLSQMSLLGYRPDLMARDAVQLFLAYPRVGNDLLTTMADYARGGEGVRQAMWDLADRHSWVQHGLPKIAAPGAFEGPISAAPEDAAGDVARAMQRGWRYDIAQKALDAVSDLMPQRLKNMQDSPLHPMYYRIKQWERMNLFAGMAQYTKTQRALAAFRALGENGNLDQLMGESAARTFAPPIQQHFRQLVAGGQDEEAAGFLARQLTDASQFRYGSIESPEAFRSTGGRIGMQLGNFSFQFYQYLRESLANGTLGDKARFLALMGGVTAALDGASKVSGWNFNKWQFWDALTFTGGPWSQTAANLVLGTRAYVEAARGYNARPEDLARMGQAGQDIANMLNPVAGLMRETRGVHTALQSPTPGLALTRLGLTGEIGNAPDWERLLNPQIQAQRDPFSTGGSFDYNIVSNSSPSPTAVPAAPALPQVGPYQSPMRSQGVGAPMATPENPIFHLQNLPRR